MVDLKDMEPTVASTLQFLMLIVEQAGAGNVHYRDLYDTGGFSQGMEVYFHFHDAGNCNL